MAIETSFGSDTEIASQPINEEERNYFENLRLILEPDATRRVVDLIDQIEKESDLLESFADSVGEAQKNEARLLVGAYRWKQARFMQQAAHEFRDIQNAHRSRSDISSHAALHAVDLIRRYQIVSAVEKSRTLTLLKALLGLKFHTELAQEVGQLGVIAESASIWKERVAEISHKIQLLNGMIARQNARDQEKAYQDRADEHKGNEGLALFFLVVSVAVAFAAVITVWFSHPSNYSPWGYAAQLVKNATILAAATIVVRVALRTWQLERNLRIVYNHRVAALRQFQVFENSMLQDNPAAKESMRLELAKLLFSDPQTGYADSRASELSISPVMTVVDQAVRSEGASR